MPVTISEHLPKVQAAEVPRRPGLRVCSTQRSGPRHSRAGRPVDGAWRTSALSRLHKNDSSQNRKDDVTRHSTCCTDRLGPILSVPVPRRRNRSPVTRGTTGASGIASRLPASAPHGGETVPRLSSRGRGSAAPGAWAPLWPATHSDHRGGSDRAHAPLPRPREALQLPPLHLEHSLLHVKTPREDVQATGCGTRTGRERERSPSLPVSPPGDSHRRTTHQFAVTRD